MIASYRVKLRIEMNNASSKNKITWKRKSKNHPRCQPIPLRVAL